MIAMEAPQFTFTAICFETVNSIKWTVSQIALVRFVHGEIRDEIKLHVLPPDDFYMDYFSLVHGIGPDLTDQTKTFDKVWPFLKPYIENQSVVAHNGYSFDFMCLSRTLEHYNLYDPVYEKVCTYQIYRHSLRDLCKSYHISLEPQNTLSAARACAELYLINLKKLYLK